METNNNLSKTIHSINNALTSLGLCAELLLQDSNKKLDKKQKNYLKIILADAKKISRLIKKIKSGT